MLITSGGTLGTYTAKELLRLGATVEILCPEVGYVEKATPQGLPAPMACGNFIQRYANITLSGRQTTRSPLPEYFGQGGSAYERIYFNQSFRAA